jgi:hypothetical protein
MAPTPPQATDVNDSANWIYQVAFQVAAHNARECTVCGPWLTHFAQATVQRDDSFIKATSTRDAEVNTRRSELADVRRCLDKMSEQLG